MLSGGYQYRLCKKGADEVTEDCFQQTPLAFASATSTIHYEDSSKPVRNQAHFVSFCSYCPVFLVEI